MPEQTPEEIIRAIAEQREHDTYCPRHPDPMPYHCVECEVEAFAPAVTAERTKATRLRDAIRRLFAAAEDHNRPILVTHPHREPGIWDADNSADRAGKPCAWCQAVAYVRAALESA